MIRRILAFAALFLLMFLCSALQRSFLPYFSVMSAIPNLVFTIFFLLIFFEPKYEYATGIFAVTAAGFLLDIPLSPYFGIAMGSLVAVYAFRKAIIFFLKEGTGNYRMFHFLALFCAGFLGYQGLLHAGLVLVGRPEPLGLTPVISLLYSLPFAVAGFYLYNLVAERQAQNKQLKLF